MIEKMDNVFLATSESNADDFKEYKDTSLDWSWDSINGGVIDGKESKKFNT